MLCVMWSLWAFCQIISIFLLWVLMIQTLTMQEGKALCEISAEARRKGLSVPATRSEGSQLSLSSVHMCVSLLAVAGMYTGLITAACLFSFGAISVLYTQLPALCFHFAVPTATINMLSVYLSWDSSN
uniref:Uncharacterized protein n=1 Tax=Pipistrellus kuhlii TaxID=59472 RepID=A0A7J7TLC1_PIPKU|nr:hypothetical protein mPipKuh1_009349 [Pipistrellus kuhlii]